MDFIKANTSRLNTDAEIVGQMILQMKQGLEKMKTGVSELNVMWIGSASEAFYKAFSEDMEALGTVVKNLEGLYSYEQNAKNVYARCERLVDGIVSEIQI